MLKNSVALDFHGVIKADDFVKSSDSRLKGNIVEITDALTKVNSLRAITYNLNALSGVSTELQSITRVGVIAQEVQAVLPQAVAQCGDYLGVSYSSLVPLLIAAVKEQQLLIHALQTKVDSLQP